MLKQLKRKQAHQISFKLNHTEGFNGLKIPQSANS